MSTGPAQESGHETGGAMRYGFSIVGAQKAGTSTLSSTLARHRHIAKSPRKEVKFFIRDEVDWSAPPYDDYVAPRPTPDVRLVGDATPAYLFWPHALERMAAYDAALGVDLRLVAIFRDPVERAFSHWAMLRARDASRPDWPDVLRRFAGDGAGLTLPAERPDGLSTREFRGEGSVLARGLYGAQLERGLALFPRERWLLLEFRSMLGDFGPTLDRVTDFLGVGRFRGTPELRHAMAGDDLVPGTAPTAADVSLLAEAYADDLALFTRLSGLDVSAWPTARVLAGELDPTEVAAKLARRVRPA